MKIKWLACGLVVSWGLNACQVVDSQNINAESAEEYRQLIREAHQEGVLDTSSNVACRVQAVFKKMLPFAQVQAQQRTGAPLDWQMVVLKSDELNAWAMPGGKMAVYTGLVKRLKLSDDEIAAIIGHEMMHAILEHSKKEINRSAGIDVVAQLGTSLLSSYTGVDGKLVGTGVELARDLGLDKPFSRDAEREADLGGLHLMAQSGYDPRSAITLWHKMNQVEGETDNNVVNKVLSTHPLNQERIQLLQKEMAKVLPIYQRTRP